MICWCKWIRLQWIGTSSGWCLRLLCLATKHRCWYSGWTRRCCGRCSWWRCRCRRRCISQWIIATVCARTHARKNLCENRNYMDKHIQNVILELMCVRQSFDTRIHLDCIHVLYSVHCATLTLHMNWYQLRWAEKLLCFFFHLKSYLIQIRGGSPAIQWSFSSFFLLSFLVACRVWVNKSMHFALSTS